MPDQYTILWERAFANDNYTIAVTLESATEAGLTGALIYSVKKLVDHSGIVVTATTPGGVAFVLHAVAIADRD